MADVFISYKREDKAWAERIDVALRGAGLTTWWDRSLQAGAQFADEINLQLSQARVLVVIWSNASAASKWVRAEALEGFNRGILAPVRIDGIALAVPFSSLHTIDLTAADGMRELVRSVVGVAGTGPIEVSSRRIKCDGGGGPLGHPAVFFDFGDDHEIQCPYCDRIYRLGSGLSSEASLIINGEPRPWRYGSQGPLLSEFLASIGDPKKLAVELNGEVIPKASWGNVRVKRGDRLEVIQFIGGG